MVIRLKSKNEKFGFVIDKNPTNEFGGYIARQLRKGVVKGYYHNENEYLLHFQERENEVSYRTNFDSEFEYLDQNKFSNSLLALDMVKEIFSTPLKTLKDEDIEGFENEIVIESLFTRRNDYIDLFQRYFTDTEFNYTEISKDNYRLSIKTNKTIHYLINLVSVLLLMISITNKYYLYLQEDIISKYINVMNNIKVPYFIAYVFKSRIIDNKLNIFKKVKTSLENCVMDSEKPVMTIGDTHTQRMNYVRDIINYENNILDIGCGEGKYVKLLANTKKFKNSDINYKAIDLDKEVIEELKEKVEKKWKLENVEIFDNYEELTETLGNDKYDIICSEVIEHNEVEDGKKVIKSLKDNVDFNKIIITTPNYEFNKFYYDMDEELRRDDHVFELTSSGFRDYIHDIFDPNEYKLTFQKVGDEIDGITPTQAVIVEKK